MKRDGQTGVILINVLIVLALASAVLVAMIRVADLGVARSRTFRDAGQGMALLDAGEASAVTALRRDMRDAPLADHGAEPWALGQQTVAIAGGSFALQITDAQARFNLNSLPGSGAAGAQVLARIVARLDLSPEVALRIGARMARPAPLRALADLVAEAGLSAADVAALDPALTVLPQVTAVNISTAPDDVLFALTDNAAQAQSLATIRARKGFLDPGDLAAVGMILLPGVGFTSAFFRVTTTVTVGDTALARETLLYRRAGPDGTPQVMVAARHRLPGE